MIARYLIFLLLIIFSLNTVNANSVIVKWQANVLYSERVLALSAFPFAELTQEWLAEDPSGASYTRLTIPDHQSDADILLALRSLDIVANVELDQVSKINQLPNDPDFTEQWHHTRLNSESLWLRNLDCSNVTIAVIDTGVQLDHPELISNLWLNPFEIAGDNIDNDLNGYIDDINGINLVENQAIPEDDNGHGTHVSGVIGALGNNGKQTVGVCWQASIMSVKVLNANGAGPISNIIEGIYYAIDNGAKIINLSLEFGDYSQAIADAIEYAESKQVVVVTAAGNSGRNLQKHPVYPAALSSIYSNLVSVAATNESESLWDKSNYSANLVDVAAPGEGIFSTWLDSSTKYLSGTSMATPIVSAAIAHYLTLQPSIALSHLKPNLWHATQENDSIRYLEKIRSGDGLNLLELINSPIQAYSEFYRFNVQDNAQDNAQNNENESEIQFDGTQLDNISHLNFYQLTQQGVDKHNLDIITQTNNMMRVKLNTQRIGYFVGVDLSGRETKPLFFEPDLSPVEIDNIKVEGNSVLLNWNPNEYADRISIFRRKGFGWSKLADVESDILEYRDDAVLENSQYQYRIRASYEYWSPAANTLVTKHSSYSSTVILNDLTQYWLTQSLFSVPYNEPVTIPLRFNHADDINYALNNSSLPVGLTLNNATGEIQGVAAEISRDDVSIIAENKTENWQQLLDINIEVSSRADWCSSYSDIGRMCISAEQSLSSVQWLSRLPDDTTHEAEQLILQIDSIQNDALTLNFQFLDQTYYTLQKIEVWQQAEWKDISADLVRDEQGLSVPIAVNSTRNLFRLVAGLRDLDSDGVADISDAFPQDATEWLDTDNDSVGDNADVFPQDATEWQDSDSDGVGDNADVFPQDATEWLDTDNDSVGDNADVFPQDATEWQDSDSDGVGDNADFFPKDETEWLDTDNDSVGDNADVFPQDATEWQDSDSDGVGDNADVFPQDATEWLDTDNDSVGDNADVFPQDATEWQDSDSDGVGDNADAFPLDPDKTVPDSAGGGLSIIWLWCLAWLFSYRWFISLLRFSA
ncbi:S8 family peptidase [Algibacillus agarilyticus]|uniref:S8 family peptidase n=1 Tax=Algibacillus agarilyticus TaxID=2234133 RepID=UPI0018E5A0BF|nr:S8 family peptidase [Algibacillus agarilyticus]